MIIEFQESAEPERKVAHNFIDLTGQRFGRLVVIKKYGYNEGNSVLWECICDCGKSSVVAGRSLTTGATKSCGCLRKETTGDRRRTHGMTRTPTYSTWCAMHTRCNNQNSQDYKHYGGRGITICSEWLKFENFLNDMGKKPMGLTIERINNDLGYFKANCRWASRTIQSRNQRVFKTNKTGITGVQWHKQCQKYQAAIRVKRKGIYLGLFNTIEEATEARRQGEVKYWGKNYD